MLAVKKSIPDFMGQALAVWVWGMAVGLLLWASGVDLAIQWWLYENYHQGFNDAMRFLSTLGKGGTQAVLCVVAAVGWALWLRRMDKGPLQVLLAVPVFLAAGVVNVVLKFMIGRPRPKEILMHGNDAWAWQPMSMDSIWWSFPSGHACSTWAIAVWLGLCFPRWRYGLWGVAVVLSFSRFLALTPHYLGDVVAGAGVGAAVALVAHGMLRRRGVV